MVPSHRSSGEFRSMLVVNLSDANEIGTHLIASAAGSKLIVKSTISCHHKGRTSIHARAMNVKSALQSKHHTAYLRNVPEKSRIGVNCLISLLNSWMGQSSSLQ